MEPEESCRICKKFFPLSLLQQHVNSGCHGTSCDHDDDHVQEGDVRDDIRKYYQFMIVLVQILGISYLAYSEQILLETSVSVAGNSTFGTAFIVSTSGSTGPVSAVRTAVAVSGNSNIGSAVIVSGIYYTQH